MCLEIHLSLDLASIMFRLPKLVIRRSILFQVYSWHRKTEDLKLSTSKQFPLKLIRIAVEKIASEGTTVGLLVLWEIVDPVSLVNDKLAHSSEDKRNVVVIPGTALDVRTPPVFPHQTHVLLTRLALPSGVAGHQVHLVSRHHELETEVQSEYGEEKWGLMIRTIASAI